MADNNEECEHEHSGIDYKKAFELLMVAMIAKTLSPACALIAWRKAVILHTVIMGIRNWSAINALIILRMCSERGRWKAVKWDDLP